MEYFLFKIIGLLFSPLAIIFLFLFVGWLLLLFKRRGGRCLTSIGMILFIICGVFPTGYDLLSYLEQRYKTPTVEGYLNGMIVLGGTFKTESAMARQDRLAVNDNIERVLDAIILHDKHPESLIVFSGGNGVLGGKGGAETEYIQRFMNDIAPQDDGYILYEDQSRNTYENVVMSKDMVYPQDNEQWLLVTSAYHMPRAIEVFRSVGWDVIPYPSDYRTNLDYKFMPDITQIQRNFAMLDLALHEVVGRFLYRLTGKISSATTDTVTERSKAGE